MKTPLNWIRFEEIGVGYAVAKSGTPYWCAIFAKPVGAGAGAAAINRRAGTTKKSL